MTEAAIEAMGQDIHARLVPTYPALRGVVVRATTGQRGHAWRSRGMVTVPTWAAEFGSAYVAYYVAHELAHIVAPSPHLNGHGWRHRAVETAMLKTLGVSVQRRCRGRGVYLQWERGRPCAAWAKAVNQ